jgi:hypothetical protein
MLTPSTTRSSRRQHAAPFPDLLDTPTIDVLPPNYRAPRHLTATPAKRKESSDRPDQQHSSQINKVETGQAPEFIVLINNYEEQDGPPKKDN